MKAATVTGNPKPRSRTFEAARDLVEAITGSPPTLSFDLIDLGDSLLDWSADVVREIVLELRACDILIVASPTYKATITGVLKLFLDRIDVDGLRGVTAVPLMLGGDLRHSLAPDVFLRPILLEIGATCPTSGLFLLDNEYLESERRQTWLRAAVPQLTASVEAQRTISRGVDVTGRRSVRRPASRDPE